MKFPAPFNFQFEILNIENSMKIVNCKLKIIFISSIIYFLSSAFLFVSPANAQTPTHNIPNPFTTPNTNPDVPKNLHTYTQNVIIEIMSAVTCQLAGIDPTSPNQQCLGVDQKTGKIGFVDNGGGAIGVMSHMISVLYTAPLHTGDYFNYLADNFGITKKAYAQGTGFEGLKPLLGLWTAFRNIVYLIFTIVFVVIGLAIMFRIKIDPRTVMTIQNQIPKIIVGIVLVTFSYAIAGFLIDIMWVAIYLFFGVFSGIQGVDVKNLNPAELQGKNPLQAAGSFNTLFGIPNTIALSVKDFVGNLLNLETNIRPDVNILGGIKSLTGGNSPANTVVDLISLFTATIVGGMVSNMAAISLGPLGDLPTGAPAGITAGVATYQGVESTLRLLIPYLIIFLIVFIALLWALFRLWFALIMAYIYILIDVVFAPFWIAGGIIPGQPITFGGWLRHILSYIAAFPTTIALFLLGKVFIDAFGTKQAAGQFVPPLIGNPTDTNAIGAIIGLGIILLSSNVVNMTTKAFKAPKIDFGRIGQAIGAGTGIAGIPGKMGQVGLMLGGMQHIPGINKIPGVNRLIGTRGGGGPRIPGSES